MILHARFCKIRHFTRNDETFNCRSEICTYVRTFVPICTGINNDIIFQAFSTKATAESRRSREQWIFQPRLEFVQARKDRSKFARIVRGSFLHSTYHRWFILAARLQPRFLNRHKKKKRKKDTRQITKQIEPAVIYRALIQRYLPPIYGDFSPTKCRSILGNSVNTPVSAWKIRNTLRWYSVWLVFPMTAKKSLLYCCQNRERNRTLSIDKNSFHSKMILHVS